MAKPFKKGLDYFPFNVYFLENRKIQRLRKIYGNDGLVVYLAILCEVYRTKGYYVLCSEDFYFDVAFTLQMDEKRVKEIIDYCVNIKLFDEHLFVEKQVLTSAGIQERYLEICKKNKLTICKELTISKELSFEKTDVSSEETWYFIINYCKSEGYYSA